MDELDGVEGVLLKDTDGNSCERDIVKFVRFNQCVEKGNLANEVLQGIPEQLCSHMERIAFIPH